MPEHLATGIVANSPTLAALYNRLRILNNGYNVLFRRAHNTYATDEYTLEMLDESDTKLKELMRMIEKVEGKIEQLTEGAKEKDAAKKQNKVEKKRGAERAKEKSDGAGENK